MFLGRGDNDPEHHSLRNTPEAKRQGPHRLARGREFFNQAEKMAKNFGKFRQKSSIVKRGRF